MSSSDSIPSPEDPWARHYREAAARRRARGWHRRENGEDRGDGKDGEDGEDGKDGETGRKRKAARRGPPSKAKRYVIAGVAFVLLTLIALLIPR